VTNLGTNELKNGWPGKNHTAKFMSASFLQFHKSGRLTAMVMTS